MQKKHITLIVFGVILSLFIAGCGSKEVIGDAPTTPFLEGSQGLEITFLKGSPPDEVTDGESFPFRVMVSLKNIGEFDLGKNMTNMSLMGFFPRSFNINPRDLVNKTPEDDPSPRKRDSEGNIIESTETFVTFPNESVTTGYFNFVDNIQGNTPFTFRVEVCYKYQTKAVSEICALANLVDVANDAICSPSGPKSVFSSGSPIAVTSFRQNVVGSDKIQLSFDVVHSGSGTIFDPTTVADCPKTPRDRRTKEDKVQITMDSGLTTDTLNCVGLSDVTGAATAKQSGIVKLVNGRRTVTCTQDLGAGRTDFKKSVDINLTFNYLSSADKEILVKHLIS